jgi:hypothetical protein
MKTETDFRPILFGDQVENLRASDLRVSPALPATDPDRRLLTSNLTDQQALDALKAFYSRYHYLVDAATIDTQGCAVNHREVVAQLNGLPWSSNQLTAEARAITGQAIFGQGDPGSDDDECCQCEPQCDPARDPKCRPKDDPKCIELKNKGKCGLWSGSLCKVKETDLWSTVAVGVNANMQLLVGGAGGMGCAWDLAQRERPHGYGYAIGEIGLGITADANVQFFCASRLPSELSLDIWGIIVSLHGGIGATWSLFYAPGTTDVIAWSIGAGVGLGAQATIFGGHIWSF